MKPKPWLLPRGCWPSNGPRVGTDPAWGQRCRVGTDWEGAGGRQAERLRREGAGGALNGHETPTEPRGTEAALQGSRASSW